MSLRKLEYGSNANPGAFRGVIGELPDGSIGRVVDDSGTAFWASAWLPIPMNVPIRKDNNR